MYTDIFDTHAHYDDSRFDEDRDELLAELKSKGICNIINCGCDLISSIKTIKMAEKYDFIYAAIGIHPHEAEDATDKGMNEIKQLYKHEKVVAVGEIGLDYHYNFSPRERQIEIFEKQLIVAGELNLPVIIHDREAHKDTLELLKKYRPDGVVHCFSGSAEMAKEIINLGLYIGLGGAVTFKNAIKPIEVAKIIPTDKLLLETDAPYMTPVPFRGKRCDSTHIAVTAEKIAQIRNANTQDLISQCKNNAKQLFKI